MGPCVYLLAATLPSFTITQSSIADPDLAALGRLQAVEVNNLWKTEIAAHIPLPQKVYSSPLTRALRTNAITFEGIPLSDNAITIVAEVRLLLCQLNISPTLLFAELQGTDHSTPVRQPEEQGIHPC